MAPSRLPDPARSRGSPARETPRPPLSGGEPHRWRPSWTGAATLLAATLIIKVTVLVQLHDHPLLQPHGELDTAYYLDLASKLRAGGPRALGEPLFVSPLYLYFLAAIFALGGDALAAKAVQIGLGTVAVGLLYATTRRWFGERPALVASALAALTGLFTFYEVLILQAALDPFLVATTLYAVSRAILDGTAIWTVGAGAAAALFGLNRPNALMYAALLPLLLGIAAWSRSHGSAAGRAALTSDAPRAVGPRLRAAARRGVLCGLGLGIVLAPNAFVNYLASGEPLLVASHGGLNFYIGNHASATGTYVPIPEVRATIAGQAQDARRVAEAATGRRLSHGEVSAYFYEQAWAWIAAHPGEALRLFGRKMLILLNRVNVPLNYSYAYYSRDEPTLLRVLLVGPWLLVPFGLLGLAWPAGRIRTRGFWAWAAFVPLYGLSVAIFFVSSRYRMPWLLPLCATAGAALVGLAQQVRAGRPGRLLVPAGIVTALVLLVHWDLHLDDGRGGEQTRKAIWLVEQGRYGEAREYVGRIAATHSHPGVLHFRVGRALATAGRLEEAIAEFEAALAVDRQPAIQLELGQALVAAGRSSEAVPVLEAALAANFRPDLAAPWLVRALALAGERDRAAALVATLPAEVGAARWETAFDLGSLALELGRPAEAAQWLRLAAAAAPDRAAVHEQLGAALLLQHRPLEAIAPLETACRLEPSRASAQLNLAVAYAAVGRINEARERARLAVRLDPTEPQARALLARLDGSQPLAPPSRRR
jgi:tetratricopeptide (TPR) repeat protein